MKSVGDKRWRKAANARKRKKNYAWVMELKANTPCADCGEIHHPVVMEFDHRIPMEKTMMVSKMMSTSASRIMSEINKCDLVCSNCHQYRTYTRGQNKLAYLGKRLGEDTFTASREIQMELAIK
jgi:ribosomal protein L32